MSRRHRDALAINDGACNPIAIVNSMKAACDAIKLEPGFRGTVSYTEDGALRLMVHQLAFLCGVASGADIPAEVYHAAATECQKRADEEL